MQSCGGPAENISSKIRQWIDITHLDVHKVHMQERKLSEN